MSRYRRAKTAGATYFFTLVAYRRQPILCNEDIRTALREGIVLARQKRPFTIDAWVLMPDHLHCLWTLPEHDADYATRWATIKRHVSLTVRDTYHRDEWLTPSKRKHRESTLWQRRYWEHQIRDVDDFNRHTDYIHYNPVKHGLAARPVEWPYSTFHRHVAHGTYPLDWANDPDPHDRLIRNE